MVMAYLSTPFQQDLWYVIMASVSQDQALWWWTLEYDVG